MTVSYVSSGTIVYSASLGSTVAPAYPASIAAGDGLLLCVMQKPATANTGGIVCPAGWYAVTASFGAGGYGTATPANDTGNMNLLIAFKTATGTETGSLTVNLEGNNVSGAQISRFTKTGTEWSVLGSCGSDTTSGNVSITTAWDIDCQAGDQVFGAFAIPTDVTTPTQFSAEALSATGVTFGTVTEISEFDTTTGLQLGGFTVQAAVTAGPSSSAVTMTATAGGTTTNVRGPGAVVRLRETNAIDTAPTIGTPVKTGPAKVSTSTTQTSSSVSWSAGDFVVVMCGATGQQTSVVPTATGLSFQLIDQMSGQSSGPWTAAYVARAASSSSGTVTLTATSSATGQFFAMVVYVVSGSTGVGAYTNDAVSTYTLSLARQKAHSLVFMDQQDWGNDVVTGWTVTPAGGTSDNVAGAATEGTFAIVSWPDQGSAGSTSYGSSGTTGTPSGQSVNTFLLEVFGHVNPATQISLTETGTGADAISVSTTLTNTETGTGTDATSIAASLTNTDTGSGADAVSNVAVAVTLTDTSTGVDVLSGVRPLTNADTGTGTDAFNTTANVPLTDTSTSADALTTQPSVPLTDTGHGTDTIVASVTLSLSETSSSADALSVNVPVALTDTGTGADAVSTINTTLTNTETGHGTDAITVSNMLALSDTSTSVDALSVNAPIALTETGTSVDALTVNVPVAFTETSTSLDDMPSIFKATAIGLTETSTGADTMPGPTVTVPGLTDTSASTDSVQVTAQVPLTDIESTNDVLTQTQSGNQVALTETGTGADAIAESATLSMSDTGHGDDVFQVTVMITFAETGNGSEGIGHNTFTTLVDVCNATETLVVRATLSVADAATSFDAFDRHVIGDVGGRSYAITADGRLYPVGGAQWQLGTSETSSLYSS